MDLDMIKAKDFYKKIGNEKKQRISQILLV